MDIRLCNYSFEQTPENDIQKVYHYQGYKVWLHTIYKYGDHASVYLYNVVTPKGELLENVDLYTINQMIFGKDYNENLLF